MRCRAIIDLDALRANYKHLEELTSRSVAILCVVKADAYGHGSLAVARALGDAGARHFAVATTEEAMVLRDGGIGAPVLVLGGLEPGSERDAALRGIDPLMGTVDELRNWDQTARAIGRKLSCHLLFNTGMNRLGIDYDPSRAAGRDEVLDALRDCEWVELRGVATHYASAEDLRSRQTEGQDRLFAKQVESLRAEGFAPRYTHAANSAAILYRGTGGTGERVGYTMARALPCTAMSSHQQGYPGRLGTGSGPLSSGGRCCAGSVTCPQVRRSDTGRASWLRGRCGSGYSWSGTEMVLTGVFRIADRSRFTGQNAPLWARSAWI